MKSNILFLYYLTKLLAFQFLVQFVAFSRRLETIVRVFQLIEENKLIELSYEVLKTEDKILPSVVDFENELITLPDLTIKGPSRIVLNVNQVNNVLTVKVGYSKALNITKNVYSDRVKHLKSLGFRDKSLVKIEDDVISLDYRSSEFQKTVLIGYENLYINYSLVPSIKDHIMLNGRRVVCYPISKIELLL